MLCVLCELATHFHITVFCGDVVCVLLADCSLFFSTVVVCDDVTYVVQYTKTTYSKIPRMILAVKESQLWFPFDHRDNLKHLSVYRLSFGVSSVRAVVFQNLFGEETEFLEMIIHRIVFLPRSFLALSFVLKVNTCSQYQPI